MQRIAAEVGFSETAFVAPDAGLERVIRYYSPAAEVSFCGHATIAAGVKTCLHPMRWSRRSFRLLAGGTASSTREFLPPAGRR